MLTRELYLLLVLLLVSNRLIEGKLIYQILPNRAVVRPGDRISFLGKSGIPITSCQFIFGPSRNTIDLSQGPKTISTDDYEYYGSGLDAGECGLTLKKVSNADEGVIQSRIKTDADSEWEISASTVRVTEMNPTLLPVFDIIPKRKVIKDGDSFTVSCNTDHAIEMCNIQLPGDDRPLNFSHGVKSDGYRYFGTGLKNGQCGATFINVGKWINGIVVCKLGDFPNATNGDGRWQIDTLNVVFREVVYQTHPKRVVERPGGSVTLFGRVGVPIASCHFFYAPSWNIIDLSLGLKSKSSSEYEYYGSGLENGECGMTLKNVTAENNGIVKSKIIINEDSDNEFMSASTLRVHGRQIYQTIPLRASLHSGVQVSFWGKVDTPILYCQFWYPPFWNITNLKTGTSTDEYEYYGSGLENGECGITIRNISRKNQGEIKSKVWTGYSSDWDIATSTLHVTDTKKPRSPFFFKAFPKRATVEPGNNSLTLTCNADRAIDTCHIFLPHGELLDFNNGVNSVIPHYNYYDGITQFRYYGTGLKTGQCGAVITNMVDRINGNVVCRLEYGNGIWETDTINIDNKKREKSPLPVFEMSPKRAILEPGDNLTFSCNTDRAIEMCHIYLPEALEPLDFKQDFVSNETIRYRYHGTGLKKGQCGATLMNIDERINGIIVCKLGNFPEAYNGVWEIDSLNVEVKSKPGSRRLIVHNTTKRPADVKSSNESSGAIGTERVSSFQITSDGNTRTFSNNVILISILYCLALSQLHS